MGFTPLAVLVFDQTIRPDVSETLAFFNAQNVALKVISGDNLRSVSAVSKRLGIDTAHGVDARTLDRESARDEFDSKVLQGGVFGRVKPEQKQAMVHALQHGGHSVAMTGDGVNDVLALKDADIGVAMGSGSSASRSVAKIVLLDNKFATLPYVVAEGRRVIGNIERVANLFLTKTTYSAMLAILVILASVPFPFQPIHVTITGWFTIGIPAFILALPPNYRRARDGFVRRVLSFAMPAGVIVGISAFAAYLIVSGGNVPEEHMQQSTAALAALIITSTWVLACVARPFNLWKCLLIALPLAGYGIIFTWSFTQKLFLLDSSNLPMMQTAVVIGGIGAVLIELLWRVVRNRLA
ncbi:HAD-IC family P-type ATPase [Arcanobacterium hippocoleae]